MADKPEDKALVADKPAAPQPPSKREPEKAPPARATKIVEETGRYICRTAITFTNEKGQRAHAKAGDVVGITPEDVKHLKAIKAVIEETREE